ncbi:MAG: hypothetical protein HOV83_01140 [Catenulispora sp.]|nr:hypothetical protein [Catenulispora sp.]
MSYVKTFLPWIIFAVLPNEQWKWAALAGLVVAVAVIVQQRQQGAGWDALIIETGSGVFFAVLAVIAFADPHSGVHDYSAALSSGVLALIAGLSLLIGKPFTLGIAKRTTPSEIWGEPLFLRTNVVITAVWTAAFAATAIALAIVAHAGDAHSTAATLLQVAGFVVPMMFTIRYVAAVQAKAGTR